MTDPMNPVTSPASAPADTENAIDAAITSWLASPTIHDDATTLAYAYAVAWALGKGEGIPAMSPSLACLFDVVLTERRNEIGESFQTASESLLTALEQSGVGMWVPFESPIS